LSISA